MGRKKWTGEEPGWGRIVERASRLERELWEDGQGGDGRDGDGKDRGGRDGGGRGSRDGEDTGGRSGGKLGREEAERMLRELCRGIQQENRGDR